MSRQTQNESRETATKPQIQERNEFPAGQTHQESKDVFSTFRKNLSRLFDSEQKATRQCQQSMSSLQNECFQAYRNTIETSLSLEEDAMRKLPFYPRMDQSILRGMDGFIEVFVMGNEMRNQITIAAIKIAEQNIRSINESNGTLQEISKAFVDPWQFWKAR